MRRFKTGKLGHIRNFHENFMKRQIRPELLIPVRTCPDFDFWMIF